MAEDNIPSKEGSEVKGFTPLYQDSPVEDGSPTLEENTAREDPYRFGDLPDAMFSTVDSVLRGWHPIETLPNLKPRVVRVFISSTFTDMANERNTLISRAYPLLRAYCRERHGLEFQAVDMRWGVQSGARDDHSTMELCAEAIENSQQHSIGPNFVVFLGQKYGYIDLPMQLIHEHFEPIRTVIKEEMTDEDIDFLDLWYKKDTNSVPTAYVLQPISSNLGDDYSKWGEIETRLGSLLLFGAEQSVHQGNLPQKVLDKMKESVTEQELDLGMFENTSQEYRDKNSLCFIRNIDDLEQHLDRSKVGRFIDLLPKTILIDPERQDRVLMMKNQVKSHLNENNVTGYSVKWSDPEGVDPTVHERYLDALNTTFYGRMRSLIDENVAHQARHSTDELYQEILQQWDLAKGRCKNFLGRQDVLEDVAKYLLDDTDQPLVIHGLSGYGKTSIIAKAASEVSSLIQQEGRAVIPYILPRFCGTSPDSSNIRQLLYSISNQLAYVTDKYRHKIPKDFKLLKAYFKDLLQNGNFTGMVIIFLDAVNQLSPADNAHKLDWLPSKIAKNVKVIVSCITGEEEQVYQKLRSKITNQRYYIEIKELSAGICGEILNSSLQKRGRILNFNQWRLVRAVFNKCSLPLFAKLTFEEVYRWKSYMDIPVDELATSVHACIQKLFDRLETKHGKIMVSHALGYITASQGGISEAEMEDILSLDDQVLNSVFSFWEPPLRRIPPILFPRIKHDVAGYLVERECDETTVMYWYHQQFIQAASERYLKNETTLLEIHKNLGDYFLGKWSGTVKKPFIYANGLAKRLRLKTIYSASVRYVPKQPLVYETYNTEKRFNFRKLNQMPYHLAMGNRLEDITKEVFFNYDFLHTKLRACSVQSLISDFSLVDNREVSLVADALRMSEAALAIDPDLLGIEISGRLLPHYHNYKNIQSLIRQCDIHALMKCPVVPNWQVFTTPGGPLQYVCEADASLNSDIDVSLIQTDDTVLLAAKPFNGTKMRVWDITQGEPQPDMNVTAGSRSYPTRNGEYINFFKSNKCLQTYRTDSGEMYGEVSFPVHGNIHQVATGNKYIAFTYKQSTGPVVIDIQAHVMLHRFQYQAKAVAISQDERYIVTNNGRCMAVHSIPMMERSCVLEQSHAPEKILFSSDHSKFYVLDIGHELKCVRVNLVQRKATASGILRDIEMKNFKLSHTENMILVRASRCLYLFDAAKEKIIHRITSMPPGVFIERLSTFKEAGFTPNDELIIAARHIYLGVWSASTGQPLRLLQSSVSSILQLFTSDTVNRAITLLQDHSIQVWNLENLDADVQHLNAIIRGSIKAMSSAVTGNRVICCGKIHAEGRILNLQTNECEWTLEHTDEIGKQLDTVMMSPCGDYAVTRMANKDYPDFLEPWEQLKEDKLWDMSNGQMIQMITSSRHVVFSPNDDKVVFFVCKNYSTRDWSIVSYDLVIQGLKGENAGKTFFLGLPDGVVIGKPVITESGEFLTFIMQSKLDGVSAKYKIQLLVYSFEKLWRGLKYLSMNDIWGSFEPNDQMIDLQPFNNDMVFVIYGHNVHRFDHLPNGVLDRNKHIYKAGFVYDLRCDNMVKRMDKFLKPNTNLDKIVLSDMRSYILDHHGQLISTIDNELVNTLDLSISKVLPNCFCLLMDGRYVALLSYNRRELLIERTSDGVCKARVYVHGVADHIQVAQNSHTVLIGCRDGHVMAFSVVLNLADPMQECIDLLPSRVPPVKISITAPIDENVPNGIKLALSTPTPMGNGVKSAPIAVDNKLAVTQTPRNGMKNETGSFSLTGTAVTLKADIKNIQNTHNMQKRLSTITRETLAEQKRKRSSFKAVGYAVLITQELNKAKSSQACVLQ